MSNVFYVGIAFHQHVLHALLVEVRRMYMLVSRRPTVDKMS